MSKVKFDIDSFGQQLIMAGLANLVEKEGLTPRESFQVLDLMKSNLWSALNEIKKESQ